jgi:hypothetical protein
MIKVTKEYLQASVTVITREHYPDMPWLGRNIISNHFDRRTFPEEMTKEACLNRLRPVPADYYGFYCEMTSFYWEYADIFNKLIKRVEKLTS